VALVSVEGLRGIQWDKSNQWDVRIDGLLLRNGSLKIFPANDLELTFFGIEEESIGSTGLSMPKTRTIPNITLSYIDTEIMEVTRFFTDWQRDIVSADGYEVLPQDEAMKLIVISKLNSKKETIYSWSVWAYPTGNIQFHGDSDGSIPMYSVSLTVVGGSLKWAN